MNLKKYRQIIILLVALVAAYYIANWREVVHLLPGSDYVTRTQAEKKIDEVLGYVDRYYVDSVDWQKSARGAIDGLLKTLDPHSVYFSLEEVRQNEENFSGKYQGIGIQFDILDGYITVIAVIPGSPSERVGLQAGDQIVKINGENAKGLTTSQVPKKLKGRPGTEVTVTIKRPGVKKTFDVTIVRDEIPIFTVNTHFMLDDSTGYVWLNRFASTTADELEDALRDLEDKGLRRLILDLRDNGGGFLRQAVQVTAKFIAGHRKVVSTRGRLARFDEDFYTDDFGMTRARNYPLILLIDHGTASAAEIVAGAIQDYDRGLIVGTNSFGKGLVQNEFELDDGSRVRLTVSKYYTPSGRLIQRPFKGKSISDYYKQAFEDTSEVQPDSSQKRPVYFTKGGRKVYGGGGIHPDVEVKFDSYSRSPEMTTRFFEKRVFFETATELIKEHPGWKSDFERFYRRFQVTPGMLRLLKKVARQRGADFSEQDFKRDILFIKNRLKAVIARNLWGQERYYMVLLQHDNQLKTARELFPEIPKRLPLSAQK